MKDNEDNLMFQLYKRLDDRLYGIERRLDTTNDELSKLKFKSGIWGSIATILTVLGLILIDSLRNLFK